MNADERSWVDEAVSKCTRASENKVTVLFVRRQDCNDEADVVVTNATDVVVTNATTPEMVEALSGALNTAKDGSDD